MCDLYKMYKSLYRILMNFALQDFPSDHLQVVVRALYFAIQSCPREPCQGDPGSTLGDLGFSSLGHGRRGVNCTTGPNKLIPW